MDTPAAARLEPAFDAGPLLAEALALAAADWVAHFNAGYHDGGWHGAALRALGGDASRLHSGLAHGAGFVDTRLMDACPAIAASLARIEAPKRAVRLLRLAPGSAIREHTDDDLRFEQGHARLHVPLATGDDVEFYVDGARVVMHPGECWYLDLSRPHRVSNRGARDRIHLVIDCEVNAWLAGQVSRAAFEPRRAGGVSGQQAFAGFRQCVHDGTALRDRLLAEAEPDAFMRLCVELGAARGFAFGVEDVRAAMMEGRRAWLSQWVL
ncbi:MAG TPA: aspartyl/asparaginyl beta-hydroxylase domain-containing protein [Usitatibacter sp.]|jgi:aspartyl/asparaginyl beta-hydroxylase (cupin superfamily)|nr:aspartyl/asparaginyl beta-hydroxylase domain-containing protein [Usitatibacter sp.]